MLPTSTVYQALSAINLGWIFWNMHSFDSQWIYMSTWSSVRKFYTYSTVRYWDPPSDVLSAVMSDELMYLLIHKRNNLKLTHAFNPIMPLQVFWMKVKLKIASGMSIYLICWGQSVLFLWLSFEKSRKEISSRVNLQNLQYTMGIPFCGWWQRNASACI